MSARKTEDTAPDIKSAAGTKAQPKNKKKQAEKGFLGHVMGLANHAEQEGIEHDQVGKTLLGPKTRFELMSRLQAQNPNPKSELNYRNSFELLCAVVLSAQSTDVAVNKASPALFAVAPDAKSMAELGPEGIAPYIQSIGLWKNKAKHLASLAQMLNDEFGGEVPDNYDDLIKLPGVGSKTAKVVLNVAFGKPYIAVDTHVFRVCNRTGLCLGKTPAEVEARLPELIDPQFIQDAHHYLLLHGRYVCTAKKYADHCINCVIAQQCRHNFG